MELCHNIKMGSWIYHMRQAEMAAKSRVAWEWTGALFH